MTLLARETSSDRRVLIGWLVFWWAYAALVIPVADGLAVPLHLM